MADDGTLRIRQRYAGWESALASSDAALRRAVENYVAAADQLCALLDETTGSRPNYVSLAIAFGVRGMRRQPNGAASQRIDGRSAKAFENGVSALSVDDAEPPTGVRPRREG
jgi:hypothetical protein